MSTRDEPLMQLCAMPLHGVGTVTAIDHGGLCTLRTAQGEQVARQAASCLLAPQAGDRVWFAGDLEQGLYVTAILERGDPASEARVRLPAHGTLDVAEGALTLRADALHFVGRQQLTVQADAAALCVGKLTGVGREATWSFGRIKLIGELIESFAERVIQFSRWSQRTVHGIDQVRASQIDYRADQTMQLQAENLVANASKLVKADGDQIHLG
ncbi:DUF3540 domain-containing protein [Variovorax sp. PBL-E5]|uniref:DUF3540 domain-containing protein n=1 Tax=Variovorax sp. PBL-E5 TaxID=434014 RepID=UPI00131644B6|nr:DUF3540 domain-containing protein [Variovorax sp. PBL-E5]VTU38925.1 hypothetical protein E5CHR_04946 [Variovorax sp. PBL-E5]